MFVFVYLVYPRLSCVFPLAGAGEAVLPGSDQLPGPQQPDGGGLHAVHPGQPHAEGEGWREGERTGSQMVLMC